MTSGAPLKTALPGAPPKADSPAPETAVDSIKHSAVRGVGWTSFIHIYRVGMGLLTTWILAILLGTDAFGLVGGAAVIVGFLMLFKDLGTGPAIVQRKELNPSVISSIFWTNVLLGVAGTASLFVAAPLVGAAFGEPELSPIVRALSFMLLLACLGTTHQSLLQRELRFARLAKIETLGITAGAIAGIGGALYGLGVWALVLQSLATMALSTVLAVLLHGFRPRPVLRLADVRGVAKFSLNLTGFQVFNHVVRNADQLLVLKVMGKSEAGLYYLAVKMLLFPLSSINSVLSRVLFPLFAKIQDDDERLRNAFLKVSSTIAMLVLPFVVGFAVMADSIVTGILPEKWLPVIPLLTALAGVALMQCLSTSVGNIYLAKGRTDLLLLWGIGTCAVSVTGFVIGVQWGTVGVARAYVLVSLTTFLPGLLIPLKLIGTPLSAFFGAVWRPAVAAAWMGGLVMFAGTWFDVPPLLDLAIRIPLGVLAYIALASIIDGAHVRQVIRLLRARGATPPGQEGSTA